MINRNRAGITLIELLIVIAIMLVIVGIAIPSIRTLTEGDAIREASRQLNLFIESERASAVENGFGGIWMERNEKDPNKVTRIYRVKKQDVYTGDFADSVAVVTPPSGNTFNANFSGGQNILFDPKYGDSGININDLIQFGGSGPWYPIVAINPAGGNYQVTCRLDYGKFTGTGGAQDGFSTVAAPPAGSLTYAVQRSPSRSIASAFELPKGTFIDLSNSGFSVRTNAGNYSGGQDFLWPGLPAGHGPIVIMFRNDGSLDRVYDGIGASVFPPSSIFMLVAEDPQNLDLNHNYLDNLHNIWVSISRAKGVVVSSQIAASPTGTNQSHRILLSRDLVKRGHDLSSN